jgi:1,4-dihydroxy-2-naphthoate octaprenyltransferase
MEKISNLLDKKINHLTWVLIVNGIILLILGVLIVWTDFMLRLVMGLIAVLVAYVFLYGAYKLSHLKKILDKYIKF